MSVFQNTMMTLQRIWHFYSVYFFHIFGGFQYNNDVCYNSRFSGEVGFVSLSWFLTLTCSVREWRIYYRPDTVCQYC